MNGNRSRRRDCSSRLFFGQLSKNELLEVEGLCRMVHLTNAARFLGKNACIYLNFDPRSFADSGQVRQLFAELDATLTATGLKPRNIVCEITERTGGVEAWLRAFVGALRRGGFRIAVDDYGAQASDARRIDQLEPDIVKFDGAWVSQLMRTHAGVLLLKMLVDDFKRRSIVTLFEGLEQMDQIEVAEHCGVDMAQGYALAYPQIVPADFSAYLTRNYEANELPASAAEDQVAIVRRADAASGRSFATRTSISVKDAA